jgi:acyl dehydratase
MRLIVGDRAPFAGGVVGAGVELSWPRPTRPGDVLRVETAIIDITPSRSKPDRGIVTLRSETRNQADEVVQLMTSRLVVSRRTAGKPSQS